MKSLLLLPVALLSIPALATPPAMPVPTFSAADLAVAGQPYKITLPPAGKFQINWGDGTVDETGGASAGHVYAKPGVVSLSIKSNGAPLTLDPAAEIRTSHPTVFVRGTVPNGAPLPAALAASADSFSAELRLWLDKPAADLVLLGSANCQFGLRQGTLYFELNGQQITASTADLAPGAWHHLAFSYDRDPIFPRSNRVLSYVDGRPTGGGTLATDDSGAVPAATFTAGTKTLPGKLASVALYNSWLAPLDVWDHARVLTGETTREVTVALPGSAPVAVDAPKIERTIDLPLNPDPKVDNGPALRKAVAAAGPGTRLRIVDAVTGKPGTFYVRSLQGAPKWAGILLDKKTDFELDGNGSELIFSDNLADMFRIEGCTRVALRNLSLDIDPAYAQVGVYARIRNVDPANRILEVQLVNARTGEPNPIIPRKAGYWRWRPHDPKTLRIGTTGPWFNSDKYDGKPVPAPEIGPGVLRFKLKPGPQDQLWKDLQAYAAGPNFYMINNADFSQHAISLMTSSHVTFEGMNFYAVLGMVFLSSSVDHVRVAHCKIGLPPGMTAADRPLSCAADGYHFHLTNGNILFEDNEITLTDDDPISLKDSITPNVAKVGPYQIAVGKIPDRDGKVFDILVDSSQSASVKSLGPGTPIEALGPDYSLLGYTATVVSTQGNVLTLDKPVPDSVVQGSSLMNRSHHTNNWIIRRNYFHDYYGRVMLYTDYGTFTENRVHTSWYHLGNSTAYFEVAGASRNVITYRNLFDRTTADSSHWGGDRILPSFHDLTFAANSFLGNGLNLCNATNSLVSHNWFQGEKSAIKVKRCRDIQIRNNLSCSSPGYTGEQSQDIAVLNNIALPGR